MKHWTDKPNPEFERWWTAKAAEGYDYGREALENVRFGFEGAQSMRWRPIESAPKDVSVLVFIPNAEHYGDGIYRAILNAEFGSWSTFGLHVGRAVGGSWWPTHWMPLPSPPETA